MLQLAGGVTAFQLKPMVLEEDAVAAKPPGDDGTVLQLLVALRISMPLDLG